MSGLLGGILQEVDYRATQPWFRDEEFYPASGLLGGVLTSTWFEDVDLGWGGPNYAPNAEVDHGPGFSRTLSRSAQLAIYNNP